MKIIAKLPAPVIAVESNIFANGICDWSPDGKYFAWSCSNFFVQLMKISSSPKDASFSWSLVRTIATGAEVWSIAFGHQTQRMKENFQNHGRYRYHVFDDILATGLSNGRIRAWDINTGLLRLELMDHSSVVRDLHFAPENIFMMASGSNDGTIKFWDFNDDGNMSKTIKTPFSRVFCCRWSPDAKYVAAGGNSLQVCLWRMKDDSLVRRFLGHVNHVSRMDFSPDGTMLASSSHDTRVIVWNILTGGIIAHLNHLLPEPSLMFAGGENGAHVTWVSFCPNNVSLVSVCETGTIYQWSLDSANHPTEKTFMEGAYSCCYSKDGRYVCIGSHSGQAMIIHPRFSELSLKQMCRNVIRKNISLIGLVDCAILPKPLEEYVLFA